VRFVADYSTNRVLVEQLGNYSSGVNDESMVKGEKRLLNIGDKVSLLYKTNFIYRLDFEDSPTYKLDSRKRTNSIINKEITCKRHCSDSRWDTIKRTLLVYNSSHVIHKNKVNVN